MTRLVFAAVGILALSGIAVFAVAHLAAFQGVAR